MTKSERHARWRDDHLLSDCTRELATQRLRRSTFGSGHRTLQNGTLRLQGEAGEMESTGNWELFDGQEQHGPFTEEAVIEAIGRGMKPTTKVRPVGKEQWKLIGSHGPFAEALARVPANAGQVAATGVASGAPRTSAIAIVGVILLAVLTIEIPVIFAVLSKRDSERELARLAQQERRDKAEADRRAEDLARAEPRRVSLKKTRHECNATNSETTCYVTNFEDSTIVACMQGLLLNKEAAGIRLYSMPMCTGPVKSNETRVVTAPWDGGRAVNICKSSAGYLDFEKCDFTVIDYAHKP
ncbi:hypothetical protein [Sorangium sp. So ce124]|uniref:hypothetical protein n=1 Tax=Sorangium sp. So ce124 TaxID=3133280 RepID=UPI003F5D7079